MSTAIQAQAPPPQWLPADNGYQVANADPALIAGATILVAGTLYLVKLKARSAAIALSAVRFSINAAGVGASTGSFGGLYSSAGQLLSGSADAGALLLGTGDLNIPLSSPGQQIPAGGFAWAALLVNLATTQPTMNRLTGSVSTGANMGLTAATLAYAVNGTVLSSLPASITPGANSAAGAIALWGGGS